MWKTVVRRLLILIPQLILLSLLIFILADYMPGDALTGMIDPSNSPARIEELRQMHGYYDPWYVKYTRWISGILRGDFGRSSYHRQPVVRIIGQRMGNTVWLGVLTVFFTYCIAVPLGVLAGRYHDKIPDRCITYYSFFAMAMPSFIAALFMIAYFSFHLGWFPWGGSVTAEAYAAGGIRFVLSRLHHVFLPSMTGALVGTSFIIQYLRSEIVDFEGSDFVTTARSKGVPQKQIYSRHIFRNALIPVASFAGFSITGVITGSIILENVFSYPGMGFLFIQSIQLRDYSVANTLILFYAVLTVLGGLLSDIILRAVDPRLRIK